MSKIDLDPITSGYNLSKINANFQKVEDELNNKVLYRDSPAGEPNSMSSNLDMNSKSILNANKISSNILELGGVQVVPTSVAVDPYNGTREALRRSYAEAGYSLVNGSFEAGGVLASATDVLLHKASGKAYSWSGAFPKVVNAGSTPATSGGISPSGKWVDVGDASMRPEIDLRAIARSNAVNMSDVQFLAVGQQVNGQHYWYDLVTEQAYTWVNPVSSGSIEELTESSDGVITIRVSGVEYELYSLSAFSLALGNTGVLVLLNNNLEAAVQLANSQPKLREIAVGVGNFELGPTVLKKGLTITGAGIDLGNLRGTRLKFSLAANEDAFSYIGTGYPPATITVQGLTLENANFATPTDAASAQLILNANNRGFWGVGDQPGTDWNPTADWQNKKSGGSNCQNLFVKNVLFEKFAFAWDVHAWMSRFEDVQTRYCGTNRSYGTSTDFERVWPQYCLYSAYQTGVVYSKMNSSSVGEQNITGISAHGLQNFRGTISLYDCGWENVLGTVYDVFAGTVNVHNETYVTDKSRKAGVWGRIRSAAASLNFYGINQSRDSDGDISDLSWNWFQADDPALLANIMFHDVIKESNLPIINPHKLLEKNWANGVYRGFFASSSASALGVLSFVPPTASTRSRRASCMDLSYRNIFTIMGDNSKASLRCNIFGSFADGATQTRPKTGTLRIKVIPQANTSPTTGNVIFYKELMGAEYLFSFSHNGARLQGGEVKVGPGFTAQGDLNVAPVAAFFTPSVNNDGYEIKLSIKAIRADDLASQDWKDNVKYRVEVQYDGSCNNALESEGKRLEVLVV